ncbi:MAG: tetratricopeptide repeat protein [Rickettsiales bacterium]|jgi:hypothetical protein|nr:tetratricopeptide repeat protein [Rickettsiales bacterium]
MAKKNQRKSVEQHSEDALYREVWEEVRAQKLVDWVRRHWKIIAAAAVLTIAIAAGIVVIRQVSHANKIEVANDFESAMNMDPKLSREALNRLAGKTSGGMGDLAQFRAYQLAMGANDRPAALAALERLADKGATRDFRDLAVVQLALIKGDDMTAADFQKLVSPIMTGRSPFYHTGLMLAAEKYLSEGKSADARPLLRKIIADEDAPAAIAAQAELLLK